MVPTAPGSKSPQLAPLLFGMARRRAGSGPQKSRIQRGSARHVAPNVGVRCSMSATPKILNVMIGRLVCIQVGPHVTDKLTPVN